MRVTALKGISERVIPKAKSNKAQRLIFLGAGMIALGGLLILLADRPLTAFVFLFFWYGYIFLLDGINKLLRGSSLIIDRTKHFIFTLVLSVFVWWFYELYNWYVFHGWEYDLIEAPKWVEFTLLPIAWATVIPGIVETMKLLESLWEKLNRGKVSEEPQVAPLTKRGKLVSISLMLPGLLFLIMPWTGIYYYIKNWPDILVWLLSFFFWGAFAMIFDPILYLTGKSSLIGDLERGRFQKFILLFMTGYLCGFLWEFWNAWADGGKWLYTASFLIDGPKIFEMPWLGFLDFGSFAVSVYVLYGFFILGWMPELKLNLKRGFN